MPANLSAFLQLAALYMWHRIKIPCLTGSGRRTARLVVRSRDVGMYKLGADASPCSQVCIR